MILDLEVIPKTPEEEQKKIEETDFYHRIEEEYAPNDEDTDEMRVIKEKIFALPEHKRRILLLWVDSGSYSAVARIMKCSAPTISKYIAKLREEIDL